MAIAKAPVFDDDLSAFDGIINKSPIQETPQEPESAPRGRKKKTVKDKGPIFNVKFTSEEEKSRTKQMAAASGVYMNEYILGAIERENARQLQKLQRSFNK